MNVFGEEHRQLAVDGGAGPAECFVAELIWCSPTLTARRKVLRMDNGPELVSHWNSLLEARVVICDFKHEHNHGHRHPAMGYRTSAEYAAACSRPG